MMNPMALLQMMFGQNPQQILDNKNFVIDKLKQIGGNNPSIPTLIDAIQNNDLQTFKDTARNLYKSQGKDVDQFLDSFKK